MRRRAQTIGPPKPYIETVRKVTNNAIRVIRGEGRPASSEEATPVVRRSGEGAPERRRDHALRVHRVVDDRDHAEEAVDHPRILAVFDRDSSAAQGVFVTLAVIVEDVAFRGDDDGRRDALKTRRL